MSKKRLISVLDSIKDESEQILEQLRSQRIGKSVSKRIRKLLANISEAWFEEVVPFLANFSISEDITNMANNRFHTLLTLVLNNRSSKSEITTLLLQIINSFSNTMIPVYEFNSFSIRTHHIEKIIENVSETESSYLEEALMCAQSGYLRSSTILGWCAAVYRMHKIIELKGFSFWNQIIVSMKTNNKVPPQFRNIPSVNNIVELQRAINEFQLLWVLECMQLIDTAQHDRLQICLTTRNTASHPGDSFTSEDNVVSFFSDLRYHLFENSNFAL